MRTGKSRRRGFTLTEILVAMAIFALGGSSIVALFLTNARLSVQAMDYTRSAEFTRNVRSLVTASLSRPLGSGGRGGSLYQFYYPGTSLTATPSELKKLEGDNYDRADSIDRLVGAPVDNTVFFRLPVQPYVAGTIGKISLRNMVTNLPSDALDPNGGRRRFARGDPEVFRFTPDALRRAGVMTGLDVDDRMHYAFNVTIRRTLQRSGVKLANSGGNEKARLDDLFVVHIRVYKGFAFAQENEGTEMRNDPIFEWDFYVAAAR